MSRQYAHKDPASSLGEGLYTLPDRLLNTFDSLHACLDEASYLCRGRHHSSGGLHPI